MEQSNNIQGVPIVTAKGTKNKMPKTVIAGLAICGAFAIAGAILSCYALIKMGGENTSNKNKTTITTETTKEKEASYDLVAANSIAKPYLKSFGYLYNIFNGDFDDNAKALVVLNNLGNVVYEQVNGPEEYYYKVTYDEFNFAAKALFGKNYDVPKTSHSFAKASSTPMIEYLDCEWDNGCNGSFKIRMGGTGGTGVIDVITIKNASLENGKLYVDYYRSIEKMCGFEEEGERCFDMTSDSFVDFAKKYSDKLPVYRMTFEPDEYSGGYGLDERHGLGEHYVLTNVEKL